MTYEDVILGAAQNTCDIIGTVQCHTQVVNSLGVNGTDILKHLRSDDRGGLFAPVSVLVDAKPLSGCVLTVEDRAILAWFTGVLRIKTFEAVVPFDTIVDVEESTTPARGLKLGAPVVTVRARQDWTLICDQFADGADRLARTLHGVLAGYITFEYDGGSTDTPV